MGGPGREGAGRSFLTPGLSFPSWTGPRSDRAFLPGLACTEVGCRVSDTLTEGVVWSVWGAGAGEPPYRPVCSLQEVRMEPVQDAGLTCWAGPGADMLVEGRGAGEQGPAGQGGTRGRVGLLTGTGKAPLGLGRAERGPGSSWGLSWPRSGLRSVSASPWGPVGGRWLGWGRGGQELVGCGAELPAPQCQVVLPSQPLRGSCRVGTHGTWRGG